jgi:phage antirepressor YoqD-like protein
MSGTDLTLMGDSPFDAIRRADERGEYWTGRDLQGVMTYANWREFAEVIEKAKAALALIEGQESADHHLAISPSEGGRWGNQRLDDYRLTRFGAYLVAMAGDDTKKAVAEARIYFAVRTRQAETTRPNLSLVPDLSGLSADGLEWLGQVGKALTATTAELVSAKRELESARTKVEYVDTFVTADEGACLLRVFANQVKVGEQALREYLIGRGVLYRTSFRRWSTKKQDYVEVNQYHAKADYKTWFTERDQPKAPRTPDGRMTTTLDITPVGKTGVLRMLQRHPLAIEGGAAS